MLGRGCAASSAGDTAPLLPPVHTGSVGHMSFAGKVALLGANGAIGRTMAPMLNAAGVPYRVVGRSLLALQVRFHQDPLCEHMQWDTEDKDACLLATAGVGTVVYLVGTALWKFRDHLPLIERALAAARSNGVQRFLLVSSSWSYGEPQSNPVAETHPRLTRTAKGKIRKEQEDRVLAAHVPGVLSTAVLRMADLYGPKVEASHLWTSFQAAKKGTEAQVLGPIDTPHEFLFVPDAAETIVSMLGEDAIWNGPEGTTWNLGGYGPTTIREMVQLIFRTEGKPEKFATPTPLMMRFVRWMNPYIRELQELDYLLRDGLMLDDRKLQHALGALKKTPYDEGVRYTLSLR